VVVSSPSKEGTIAILKDRSCYECAHYAKSTTYDLCWVDVVVPAVRANNLKTLPESLTCDKWENKYVE
jgi:hypothetical protein